MLIDFLTKNRGNWGQEGTRGQEGLTDTKQASLDGGSQRRNPPIDGTPDLGRDSRVLVGRGCELQDRTISFYCFHSLGPYLSQPRCA